MTGQYKNRVPMIVDTSKYGVTIMPEPIYQFPKGHPCYGCVFTLNMNKPSCLTGNYSDTETCINTFYKKILERHRAEYYAKIKSQEEKWSKKISDENSTA